MLRDARARVSFARTERGVTGYRSRYVIALPSFLLEKRNIICFFSMSRSSLLYDIQSNPLRALSPLPRRQQLALHERRCGWSRTASVQSRTSAPILPTRRDAQESLLTVVALCAESAIGVETRLESSVLFPSRRRRDKTDTQLFLESNSDCAALRYSQPNENIMRVISQLVKLRGQTHVALSRRVCVWGCVGGGTGIGRDPSHFL